MEKINWQAEEPEDLTSMVTFISDLSYMGMFGHLDYIISQMPLKTASTLALTAFLRYSSQSKHKLPSWKPMLQKVHDEMVSRGEDAESNLFGMLYK